MSSFTTREMPHIHRDFDAWLQAASRGEVQRSLNTLYGSVLSTLCLTVPAVLLIGELIHTKVILGLEPLEMVLLGLTLFLVRPTNDGSPAWMERTGNCPACPRSRSPPLRYR